jgi:hypothetical protein
MWQEYNTNLVILKLSCKINQLTKDGLMQKRTFMLWLIGISLFYLGFEAFFNQFAIIGVDEFWFAHNIYQYKDKLPYRDFAPYKTVLGYYILLIPMLFTHGIIATLIIAKQTIALLNTIAIMISACWLSKFFSRTAVITSLALIIFSETVLSYSTNIRVDVLGYWFCLFSLLCLLDKRYIWAGILIGLGFATTQKTLWFLFASNIALLTLWLVTSRNRHYFISIIKFNLVAFACISIYITCWSLASGLQPVLNSVFYEAYTSFQLNWYAHMRKLYWSIITIHNPLLFLLWPVSMISLFITYQGDQSIYQRRMVTIYGLVIFLCILSNKQVFPYYMQAIIPSAFALYAGFFSWTIGLFNTPYSQVQSNPVNFKLLWSFLIAYTIALFGIISLLNIPTIYLLICFVPGLLLLTINYNIRNVFNIIFITILFIGFIYPLTLFSLRLLQHNGDYQQTNILTANALLEGGGSYIAGVDFIYNKNQSINGLQHIMTPALNFLYSPSNISRPIMRASLNENPHTTEPSIILALQQADVKLYINNYRIMNLPSNLKHYLSVEFEHWRGSIYLYAPTIPAGNHTINIKFPDNYLIESNASTPITIDNHAYNAQSTVFLNKGPHNSNAPAVYRLKLTPLMHELSEEDHWEKMVI